MKVRYYGHVGQVTGYGRAAEAMCMALVSAGVELEIRPLCSYEQVKLDSALPLAGCIRRDWELTAPDVVIVHTLPLDCKRVVEIAGLKDLGVPLVVYTTWEGCGQIPGFMACALEGFTQMWTPSTVNQRSMVGLPYSVHVMPHAFDEESLASRRAPGAIPYSPELYTFYYLGAWNARKYPEGIIRAYTRMFTKSDPVCLMIRSVNALEEDFALAWHRTGFTPATSPLIRFASKPISDDHILNLHREADCFVTASRGEGWNLPAFEALLAGRHVISPRHLGSDEFLEDTTASLYDGYIQPAGVDVRIVPVPEGKGPVGAVGLEVVGAQGQSTASDWREPDLNQLASAMYRAYLNRTRVITTNYDVAERFGYRAVGKKALTYLEAL